jgi:hypothetical protein
MTSSTRYAVAISVGAHSLAILALVVFERTSAPVPAAAAAVVLPVDVTLMEPESAGAPEPRQTRAQPEAKPLIAAAPAPQRSRLKPSRKPSSSHKHPATSIKPSTNELVPTTRPSGPVLGGSGPAYGGSAQTSDVFSASEAVGPPAGGSTDETIPDEIERLSVQPITPLVPPPKFFSKVVTGTIRLDVAIGEDGKPLSTQTKSGTGDPDLDAAFEREVRSAAFDACRTVAGTPLPCTLQYTISFTVERENGQIRKVHTVHAMTPIVRRGPVRR